MPRELTIRALAGAVAEWIARCRDAEDLETSYEREYGREWNQELWREWREIAAADPEVREVLDMASRHGGLRLAVGLRRDLERFYERHLSEPAPAEPAPGTLRPVLVVDNARRSRRPVPAAGGARGRAGSTAGRSPGGRDAA